MSETAVELIVFVIALTLACIAGFEFFYLMYQETVNRQHKRRIAQLERELLAMARELEAAKVAAIPEPAEEIKPEELEAELWPEVIDDDPMR